MRDIQNIAVIILCAIFFFGCGSPTNNNADVITVKFDNSQPRPVEVGNYFSDIKLVPLETTMQSVFSYIKQTELKDSLLFICDDNKLVIFNTNGEFISNIGRQGRGPGEFGAIKGFFIDPADQTVSIIDGSNGRLIKYGLDGEYISSREIPDGLFTWGYYAMHAGDDKVLIFNTYNPIHNMAYTLMDLKEPQKSEAFHTYSPVELDGYAYHFAQHPMTHSGDDIHFTMPFDNIIYKYSDGEVVKKYYVEVPQDMVSKDMFQKMEGTYIPKLLDLTMKDYFGGFTDIFETDNLLFLHYMAKYLYPGLYVMDKKSGTGSYFSYPSTEDVLKYPVFPFSTCDGNTIISIVSEMDLNNLRDYITANEISKDQMSAELYNALNNMTIGDNPLLAVYTIRK